MELMIQARTSIRYDYSYIETAALMLGSEVLEVSSFGEYAVNGVRSANLHAATIGGFPIYHSRRSTKHSVFDVVKAKKKTHNLGYLFDCWHAYRKIRLLNLLFFNNNYCN